MRSRGFDRFRGYAPLGFVRRTPAPPPFSGMKKTPATSNASRMSFKVRSYGERFPASKFAIVALATLEAVAS